MHPVKNFVLIKGAFSGGWSAINTVLIKIYVITYFRHYIMILYAYMWRERKMATLAYHTRISYYILVWNWF